MEEELELDEAREVASRVSGNELELNDPVVEKAEGGDANHTFFVSSRREDFVIKICRLPHWVEHFVKEVYGLDALAEHPLVPDLVDYCLKCETPWIVTERLDGDEIKKEFERWSFEERRDFLQEIGLQMAETHRLTKRSESGRIVRRKDSLKVQSDKWRNVFEEILDHNIEHLDKDYRERAERLKPAVLKRVSEPEIVCLNNNEVSPRNVLANERKLTGLIDWEFCYYGDGLMDLAIAEKMFIDDPEVGKEKKLREALLSAYSEKIPLDNYEERETAYKLSKVIVHLYVTQGENKEKAEELFNELEAELGNSQ